MWNEVLEINVMITPGLYAYFIFKGLLLAVYTLGQNEEGHIFAASTPKITVHSSTCDPPKTDNRVPPKETHPQPIFLSCIFRSSQPTNPHIWQNQRVHNWNHKQKSPTRSIASLYSPHISFLKPTQRKWYLRHPMECWEWVVSSMQLILK